MIEIKDIQRIFEDIWIKNLKHFHVRDHNKNFDINNPEIEKKNLKIQLIHVV